MLLYNDKTATKLGHMHYGSFLSWQIKTALFVLPIFMLPDIGNCVVCNKCVERLVISISRLLNFTQVNTNKYCNLCKHFNQSSNPQSTFSYVYSDRNYVIVVIATMLCSF